MGLTGEREKELLGITVTATWALISSGMMISIRDGINFVFILGVLRRLLLTLIAGGLGE